MPSKTYPSPKEHTPITEEEIQEVRRLFFSLENNTTTNIARITGKNKNRVSTIIDKILAKK